MINCATARSAAAKFVSLAALSLCFFFAIRYFVVDAGAQRFLYNSDAVQPFLYVDDLLREPWAVFTWYNSPSFYTIPDVVLATAIVVLGIPAAWQPVAFSATMATLLSLAAGFILHELVGVRTLVGAWTFAFTLFVAGTIVLASPGHAISIRLMTDSVAAFTHSGALLMTFWAMAIALFAWHKPTDPWPLAILFVLSACATFSDLIFVVWFSIPMFVTGLFSAGVIRSMPSVLTSLAVLVGSGVGYLLNGIFNTVIDGYLSHRSWPGLWRWMKNVGYHALVPIDLLALISGLLLLLLAGYAVHTAQRMIRTRQASAWQIFTVLVGCAASAAFLAPLLTRYVVDLESVRYFLAAFALVLLWALTLPQKVMIGLLRPAVITTPVGVAAIGAALALHGAGAPHLSGYRDLLQCLKKADRNAGLADYWNTMSLMQASSRAIHMFALTEAARPYHWNIDGDWLYRRADNGKRPRFDFIITTRLDEGRLRERFGNPDVISRCGGQTLWFYGRPLDVARRP